ncbi:DUF433 domain-containing protein [Sphingomonas sp.]|uniref:DUF433 domain-containing protein n=1 Tax=Sphingomonas sp. TaxID=28214 RepID=UPI00307DA157
MKTTGTVLRAFSVDHAARVTGLSKSRLARWDREGFFSPEHVGHEDKGKPFSRVYSFTDLVGLRTLAILTQMHGISIQELRKTYPVLAEEVKRPWSDKQLSVVKKKVVWDLDATPRDRHGQTIGAHIELPTIAEEVAQRANELRDRDKAKIGLVERHRYIAHNAPVVAGTRIPTRAIESFIEEGYSDKAIIAEYPSVTRLDIAAVRSRMKAAA